MKEELRHIIESLLFVSDTPLSVRRIRQILDLRNSDVIREALRHLAEEYETRKGGFYLEQVAGGYQLRTRPENKEWIRRMLQTRPARLSKAAMETLAIIAYKQPIIRSDIEHIRGVDCGGVLRILMERKLIRVMGRKEIPGRPMIYGTTREFLEMFNLRDLKDLPSPKEIEALSETGGEQIQLDIPLSEDDDAGETKAAKAEDAPAADAPETDESDAAENDDMSSEVSEKLAEADENFAEKGALSQGGASGEADVTQSEDTEAGDSASESGDISETESAVPDSGVEDEASENDSWLQEKDAEGIIAETEDADEPDDITPPVDEPETEPTVPDSDAENEAPESHSEMQETDLESTLVETEDADEPFDDPETEPTVPDSGAEAEASESHSGVQETDMESTTAEADDAGEPDDAVPLTDEPETELIMPDSSVEDESSESDAESAAAEAENSGDSDDNFSLVYEPKTEPTVSNLVSENKEMSESYSGDREKDTESTATEAEDTDVPDDPEDEGPKKESE